MRRVLLASLAVAALGAPSPALAGHSTNPSCPGRIISGLNHGSGELGASGNPQSSAGPGYFFHENTSDNVQYMIAPCKEYNHPSPWQ